jgi:hypothetical protein
MNAMNGNNRPRFARPGGFLVFLATLGIAMACDTSITNPGGAQDEFLDSLTAHEALVTGTRRSLAEAMDWTVYWSAAMTFEINPAGSTGSWGIESYIQAGRFNVDDTGEWNETQEARWTAEDAVERFRRALAEIPGAPDFATYDPAARALVFAGYANRLLGEMFCQVTFDGGPLRPHTDAFVRADSLFRDAKTMTQAAGNTEFLTAAQAGRASVLANLATYGLASWADAAAEAAQVPDDFVFAVPYSAQDDDQHNHTYWANANLPYRAHTTWGTYWENVTDPRTPFRVATDTTGDAAVAKFGGLVPWYPQMKYDAVDSPIPLASGWEMRLIRAEAALDAGDLDEAATQMNVRRTNLGLPLFPVPFASVADGYTALKTERAAELWLQGRRMHDVRRWLENSVPGTFVDGNYRDGNQDNQFPNKVEDLSSRARAYFVGLSEVETNPNVDSAPGCSG